MSNSKLIFVIVLIFAFALASANGGLFGWKGVHGSLGKVIGSAQTIDLSNLNDDIEFIFEVTYPETFLSYGAQYLYLSNNLAIGVEGYILDNGTHKDQIYTYQVSANAFLFDLGYVLYSNYYTVLTPG